MAMRGMHRSSPTSVRAEHEHIGSQKAGMSARSTDNIMLPPNPHNRSEHRTHAIVKAFAEQSPHDWEGAKCDD